MRKEFVMDLSSQCQQMDTVPASSGWTALGSRIRQAAMTATTLHVCRPMWDEPAIEAKRSAHDMRSGDGRVRVE